MRGPVAIVAAGATFAGTVLAAGALAIWLGGAHHPEYVLPALLAGIAAGGYSAYRLVRSALSN
ncbi:MAG TPA: hypothetical protein VGZ02_01615 [Candidatus Baltobacteraceae bacterium]|jgi:hypothetical protein|nr:hypothetical protein [Candidatus Baltobacteraceae bacterium]